MRTLWQLGIAVCGLACVAQPPGARRVSGQLTGETGLAIARAASGTGESVVIVLGAVEVRQCEDVGRQLREALRTPRMRGVPVILVTGPDSGDVVRAWLQRQRIDVAATVTATPPLMLAGGVAVTSPAMLLVDRAHGVRAGIVHTTRVPDTRVLSFADELGLR